MTGAKRSDWIVSEERGPRHLDGHTLLPRGAIAVSEPRELLGAQSRSYAYEPGGTPASDTMRNPTAVLGYGLRPAPAPVGDPVEVHEREVLYGGELAGQFGHFLAESVNRLWPLAPGNGLEGVPVVLTKPRDKRFVQEWLAGFGAEVIFLPRRDPARFKRMLVPEASWRFGAWIAPELRDTHLHARRGLAMPPTPRHDVLWLSRGGLPRARAAYDEALLEWILGDRVTPVRLEEMSLAEQVGVLESSRAIAGVMGSAFHGLLLTVDTPDSLYMCSSYVRSTYLAQHRVLGGRAAFVEALTPPLRISSLRRKNFHFPGGHIVQIPRALRALREALLPDLGDQSRIWAFANPGRRRNSPLSEIDAAVLEVLRDPLSAGYRERLGAMFAERGLDRCASEQLDLAARLSPG